MTRIQLSLYLPEAISAGIESVRRLLDPIQSQLIPAHVTLCREDELDGISHSSLAERFADIRAAQVTLQFGPAEVFDSHGVLLPCVSGEASFHGLRAHLLGNRDIRRPLPHITLAHPRNPRSAGNTRANIGLLPATLSMTFRGATLIQQVGHAPWLPLEWYSLHAQ